MAKKKFGLFDFTKEGKGVRKEDYVEDKPFALSTFFKTLGRNFWNFSGLNFLYIVINLPLFFGLYARRRPMASRRHKTGQPCLLRGHGRNAVAHRCPHRR